MSSDDPSASFPSNSSSLDRPLENWTAEQLHQASYSALGSPTQVEDRFLRHLLSSEQCRESLQILLTESSTTTRDYSVTIDTFDLLDADPILGHLLLRFPTTLLPLLESAAVRAQEEILQQLRDECDGNEDDIRLLVAAMTVKGAGGSQRDNPSHHQQRSRVHARLIHLPPWCFKPSLAKMQAHDVGRILQVTGTVVRTSPLQMYESARMYQCGGSKGCKGTFFVHADMEQRHNALAPPEHCLLKLANTGEACTGTHLTPVEGGSVHTDYQEIKIQEAASRLGVGHIPRSLLIKLQHDLVETCQPGDEVVVVGSLLAQWHQVSAIPDADCQIGMAMSAHSVRVVADKGSSAWKNTSGSGSGNSSSVGELDNFRKEFELYWNDPDHIKNPIQARDFICQAVCPKLYGLQVIKLALLLTLIGGVSSDAYEDQRNVANGTNYDCENEDNDEPVQFSITKNDTKIRRMESTAYHEDSTGTLPLSSLQNGVPRRKGNDQVKTRRRDQSHMLLVGDPGTGKSQVLRFAAALCPRSVLTTGVGTTSAGLTCAAVREGGSKEFALEAGALVLADKGVCCIDEFGCIQEKDRTTIHEAMEQQTLSVAKAGIVCKLNCRATIIAVMNPRECLYDNHSSLSVNTGLGTPLLSRFDLIFKLVDASDVERDSNVTTYLLNRAIQGAGLDVQTADENQSQVGQVWSMEKLRAYISVIRERFQPDMSDAAALFLERHYEKCRSAQSNTIPVTVRFLESLIRLSQAHARLMFQKTVTLEDAVAVVRVMECSAFAYGGFDGIVPDFETVSYCDPMTTDFSTTADSDFVYFEYVVLNRYGMLKYMEESRLRQAEQVSRNGAGDGSVSCTGSATDWHDVEKARDCNYVAPSNSHSMAPGWNTATSSFSMPSRRQDVSFSTSTALESLPLLDNTIGGSRSAQTHTMTQDHYGRFHLSQPTNSKRSRVS